LDKLCLNQANTMGVNPWKFIPYSTFTYLIHNSLFLIHS